MKYLVTGGNGFIGSNMVDRLVADGHEVSVIDDLSTGRVEYENPKATYYTQSITDPHIVDIITKDIDCVFHFAAWARLQRSIDDPVGTNNANEVGTLILLEACRRNNVPRFVFSSSSSVYGDQETAVMQEDMTLNPLHPYALQKWMSEKYCQMYSRLFGLETVCLRYFNVYGPRQIIEGDYSLVIGKFIHQKSLGNKLTIYGDGEQTRAYTHVVDVVEANVLASQVSMKKHENIIVNIGTVVETSVNAIAEMIGGEVDHIIPNPRGNFEERRKCADITKAFEVLGWKPTINIKEGIQALL